MKLVNPICLLAIILVAGCAHVESAGVAFDDEKYEAAPVSESTRMACPEALTLDAADMTGTWHAIFGAVGAAGTAGTGADAAALSAPEATLELGPHPDYAGSLRGNATRGSANKSLLAGDIEDGELLLEESTNGKTIAATWTGRVAGGSCGQTIEGTWNDALTSLTRPFRLTRAVTSAPP